MARVVDRLLAQLPGLQGASDARAFSQPHVHGRIPHAIGPAIRAELPTPAGLWGRVTLALALGVMMSRVSVFP